MPLPVDVCRHPLPPALYKYRSLRGGDREHCRRAIVDCELYLASPSAFNDPFEFYFNVVDDGTDLAATVAALRRTTPSITPRDVAKRAGAFPAFLREVLEEKAGILSLSTVPDHILMWSHYADMHKGVCLIVDPASLAGLVDDLGPVTYAESPLRLAVQGIVGPGSFPENLLRMKARVWEYEGEWRATRFSDGAGSIALPPKGLLGVILGHRISVEDAREVRLWAEESPAKPVVYAARASADHYGLTFEPPLP